MRSSNVSRRPAGTSDPSLGITEDPQIRVARLRRSSCRRRDRQAASRTREVRLRLYTVIESVSLAKLEGKTVSARVAGLCTTAPLVLNCDP